MERARVCVFGRIKAGFAETDPPTFSPRVPFSFPMAFWRTTVRVAAALVCAAVVWARDTCQTMYAMATLDPVAVALGDEEDALERYGYVFGIDPVY